MRTSSVRRLALGCALLACLCGPACHRDLSTGNILVAVSPASASLLALASQPFTAAVTGSDNPAVTWSVREGASGGTISAAGLYQAPAVAGTFHVVATAQADPTQSASATVVVKPAPPVVRAPAGLAYLPDSLVCTQGVACGLPAPTAAGDPIASFAVSPPLPAGLALDPATGAIVGTPTIVSAAASFQITASNAGGSDSASVTIAVLVAPPADLAYAGDLACYQGVACSLAAPASSGGPIDAYAIAPALPAGLRLDASTGAIVGTPTILAAPASYTVTGSNASGSASASVTVSVSLEPPANLVYSPAALVCPVYASCALAAPTSSGGPIDGYAISAQLPGGLGFDGSTGAISGAANLAIAATSFTITASNAGGSASATITVTITPLMPTTLSMGYGHTCMIQGGGVSCWGVDVNGELGNNTTSSPDGSSRYLTPVAALGLEAGVTAIGGGDFYSCALQGGGVKCWGQGTSGKLGNNATADSLVPAPVIGLTSGVDAISVSTSHACALVEGGGVQCWGANASGQLGNNSTADSAVAVQVAGLTSGVQAVAAGDASSCALTSTGAVLCWGDNSVGALGDNSTAGSLVPVQVAGLTSGVQEIGVGDHHACARVGGAVSCWGGNDSGQLGDNSTASSLIPVAMAGATSVDALRVGGDDTCVLSGGAAMCTGTNLFGSLGDRGPPTYSPILVQVYGLASGVAQLFTGEDDSCAFTATQIICWGGAGYSRQLGDAQSTEGNQPVPLVNLAPPGN